MQFSIMDLWFATGPVGRAVVLVLLALSMASISVGTERLLALRRARKLSAEFLAAWRTREERPWSGTAALRPIRVTRCVARGVEASLLFCCHDPRTRVRAACTILAATK